jgi:hypothetical protein
VLKTFEGSILSNTIQFFFKVIPYVVQITTGDRKGAGTDADVFVQLYGPDGKSEEIYLRDNRTDNFKREKVC